MTVPGAAWMTGRQGACGYRSSRLRVLASSATRVRGQRRRRCQNPRQAGWGALSPGKPVSGPAKAYLSRQNRDFLGCAKEGLTARLNGDRRWDGRKPRRNDEPQRDAGHTGSTGSHRPTRRRDRRRVQLRAEPADQLAKHPGALLTPGELAPGSWPTRPGENPCRRHRTHLPDSSRS